MKIKLKGQLTATGITNAYDPMAPPQQLTLNNVLIVGEGNPGDYRVVLRLSNLNGNDDTETPEAATGLFYIRVDAYDAGASPLRERAPSEQGAWLQADLNKQSTLAPFTVYSENSSVQESVFHLYGTERLTYNVGTHDPSGFHGVWTADAEIEVEKIG